MLGFAFASVQEEVEEGPSGAASCWLELASKVAGLKVPSFNWQGVSLEQLSMPVATTDGAAATCTQAG